MTMENDFTTGSIRKTMLLFSLPHLLAYFLQTLYGMADLQIIGQFCPVESTTAVSVGGQVMHMLTVMTVGLSTGGMVKIGRAVGGKDPKSLSRTIGNTVSLFLALALVLTAVLSLLVRPVVQLMSVPPESVREAALYLRICFLGIPCITAYTVISSILRGMGDAKHPMYFIAVSCAANILLDYVLIGGLHLGAAGAALGTVLSQLISVLVSLPLLFRQGAVLQMRRADFRAERDTMRGILKIGIPIAVQDGLIQIAFLAITVFANHRGLHDAAAVGIVEKIICILFLVPSAMSQTVSALSAQNLGAGKPERARQILYCSCAVCTVWGALAVAGMHFSAAWCIGLFSDSAEVISHGVQYLQSYVWDCIFAGLHFSFSGYFCALGLSSVSFLHNSLSMLLIRLPGAYYAAEHFKDTLFPMGLAAPAGSLLSVLICAGVFLFLTNRKKAGKAGTSVSG